MKKLRRQCLWWGWTGASISALSAIDIALWDIKGKIANAPVYTLLNTKANEQIPLYASGGTPKPPEELRRRWSNISMKVTARSKYGLVRGVRTKQKKRDSFEKL
jgi:L-alanine-DL-glutamate epimerase-like enolase superfamily enzyme